MQFFASGPDLSTLARTSQRLVGALEQVSGAVDIDASLVLSKPELSVTLDRYPAAHPAVPVAYSIFDALRTVWSPRVLLARLGRRRAPAGAVS